jgi:hypothetical protein
VPATPRRVRALLANPWFPLNGHVNDSTLVSLKHTMNMRGCLCGALSCKLVQLPPLEWAALLQPLPLLLSHLGVPKVLSTVAGASAPATPAKGAAPPGVHTRGRDSAAKPRKAAKSSDKRTLSSECACFEGGGEAMSGS